MEDKELIELKRELYKDIDNSIRQFKAFKRRISIIANLLVPGIGFVIYGSSYLKGIITFVLFCVYNIIFFNISSPNIDFDFSAFIFYSPAIAIWIVSTMMVSGLDD